jgi:hypothetical protein
MTAENDARSPQRKPRIWLTTLQMLVLVTFLMTALGASGMFAFFLCPDCSPYRRPDYEPPPPQLPEELEISFVGTIMAFGGVFGCVVGTALVGAAEALTSLYGKDQPAVSPTFLTVVGCTALTASGFMMLRGVKGWQETRARNLLVIAWLLGLAAVATLVFMAETCSYH